MSRPHRVQRKRTKGYRLPANTVCVDRTTRYGNPFVVGKLMQMADIADAKCLRVKIDQNLAVELYRIWAEAEIASGHLDLEPLRGKHHACFCPLSLPCHADVTLELANR